MVLHGTFVLITVSAITGTGILDTPPREITMPTVNCPTCRKSVEWSTENTHRPFCSDRCRLIDLGEWADGNRYIPMDPEHDEVTSADLDRD